MAKTIISNNTVRKNDASVYLYDSTHIIQKILKPSTFIKSIEIERVGDSGKFFGFGVCQKLNLKLIDTKRELSITTDNYFLVNINGFYFPNFFVTETHRDEITNELSITAYDFIYFLGKYKVAELGLKAPYTVYDVVSKIFNFKSKEYNNILQDSIITGDAALLNLSYPEGANLDGSELLRDVLNAAAEVTGCIYYLKYYAGQNSLVFKPIDKETTYQIPKEEYFNLTMKDNRRLATITHATELGDNVSVSASYTGSTQILRENPFISLRDDVNTILETLHNNNAGMTMAQFELEWRGSLLEPVAQLELVNRDDSLAIGYLINDVITFDGALVEKTEWSYSQEEEMESNPSSLGDALKSTYARVDKANKQIELVAQNATETTNQVAELQIETGEIKASVETNREEVSRALDEMNNTINRVEASLTDEALSIKIETLVGDGAIDEVTTSTGFTFNSEGLTVSKATSEMTTTITEDGMQVSKDGEAQLTANNTGVIARNLHAETYLIIGVNSRFEDFTNNDGEARTGCFWIGG